MSTPDEKLEAMLKDFEKRTAADTNNPGKNLRNLLGHSPDLKTRFLDSVGKGHLERFDLLPADAHAGGTYNSDTKSMELPQSYLDSAGTSKSAGAEMVFVMGHEIQHSFNSTVTADATNTFVGQVNRIAQEPGPHDYTTAIDSLIRTNRRDEASANIGGFNALASQVQKDNPKATLKDFYDSQPFRMGDFIDRTGTPPNSSYTLKPGLTVDKNMHMETSKENVEAMGKYYFDKKLMPPNGLGPKANQNYHNYYGEWALNYVDITEKAAQAAHKSDPKYVPPKVEVDLQKIGLDKAQLDTHLNYADTSLGKARPIVEGVNTSGRNGSSLGNAGFGLDDPRNAQNPNHALYGQLKERIPDASEQRLLQFTAACHSSKITGKNLGVIHFDRADGNMIFGATWPPGPSTSVDLKIPSPEPQQSIQEIKQNDQQQAQTRTDIQAQIAQQNNAQGQQGPAMVGP